LFVAREDVQAGVEDREVRADGGAVVGAGVLRGRRAAREAFEVDGGRREQELDLQLGGAAASEY
jgi:hypothetical protein